MCPSFGTLFTHRLTGRGGYWQELGVLEASGKPTPLGAVVANMPAVPPRLGRALVIGAAIGCHQ
eukprot:984864-Pyramimonas_sp.AAC.1